jgi:hypothetical protein
MSSLNLTCWGGNRKSKTMRAARSPLEAKNSKEHASKLQAGIQLTPVAALGCSAMLIPLIDFLSCFCQPCSQTHSQNDRGVFGGLQHSIDRVISVPHRHVGWCPGRCTFGLVSSPKKEERCLQMHSAALVLRNLAVVRGKNEETTETDHFWSVTV